MTVGEKTNDGQFRCREELVTVIHVVISHVDRLLEDVQAVLSACPALQGHIKHSSTTHDYLNTLTYLLSCDFILHRPDGHMAGERCRGGVSDCCSGNNSRIESGLFGSLQNRFDRSRVSIDGNRAVIRFDCTSIGRPTRRRVGNPRRVGTRDYASLLIRVQKKNRIVLHFAFIGPCEAKRSWPATIRDEKHEVFRPCTISGPIARQRYQKKGD